MNDEDIDVEVFPVSIGQYPNIVQITHKPSGVTAESAWFRTEHENIEFAKLLLRVKLLERNG